VCVPRIILSLRYHPTTVIQHHLSHTEVPRRHTTTTTTTTTTKSPDLYHSEIFAGYPTKNQLSQSSGSTVPSSISTLSIYLYVFCFYHCSTLPLSHWGGVIDGIHTWQHSHRNLAFTCKPETLESVGILFQSHKIQSCVSLYITPSIAQRISLPQMDSSTYSTYLLPISYSQTCSPVHVLHIFYMLCSKCMWYDYYLSS